jgi:hypothetical protein
LHIFEVWVAAASGSPPVGSSEYCNQSGALAADAEGKQTRWSLQRRFPRAQHAHALAIVHKHAALVCGSGQANQDLLAPSHAAVAKIF